MPETPEQKARRRIDAMLFAAGWLVQDRRRLNLHAAPGVALCETDVEGGFADYMLFVDARAIGAFEAKAEEYSLVGVADESELYARAALTDYQRWSDPLPFTYESNGEETRFRDLRDPRSRSRFVFSAHRPETLRACLPACDRYFIDGFKAAGFSYSYLNAKFVTRLSQIAARNLPGLRTAQSGIASATGVATHL